jgi:hypothetical protein
MLACAMFACAYLYAAFSSTEERAETRGTSIALCW